MTNAVKTMFAGAVTFHFLKAAIAYNAAVFAVFLAVYLRLDFNAHFASNAPVTVRGKVYYALMTHTAAGCSDIMPSTDLARTVTSMHVLFAWMQLVLVFLA